MITLNYGIIVEAYWPIHTKCRETMQWKQCNYTAISLDVRGSISLRYHNRFAVNFSMAAIPQSHSVSFPEHNIPNIRMLAHCAIIYPCLGNHPQMSNRFTKQKRFHVAHFVKTVRKLKLFYFVDEFYFIPMLKIFFELPATCRFQNNIFILFPVNIIRSLLLTCIGGLIESMS
jgi:hypothetical protein